MKLRLLLLLLLPGLASAQWTVDLGETFGPITHRGSGFLWGLSKDKPGDELLRPLRVQKFRSRLTPWIKGSGIESFPRMKEMGATIQVVVSDEYNLLFKDKPKRSNTQGFAYGKIDVWPGDKGDFSMWEKVIEDSFRRVEETGIKVEWDVWEEPNWKGWWGRDREQFFETYARFHRKLRQLDPEAVIVGPSINKFDPDYLKAFLLYAKKNDVLPDILSWHEIIEQHRPIIIPRWVATMEAFMAEHDIEVQGIDIGEFCSPKRQTSPGANAMYLANLEVAGVHGACRACWRDHDGKIFNGWQPMLNGLLTPQLKPRSTWWAFRAYGELSGQLAPVMKGKWVHGIAGVDEEDRTVGILIGRNELPAKNQQLWISGLRKTRFLQKRGKVQVVARRIPHSAWDALAKPTVIQQELIDVDGDALLLNFPQLKADDALWLTLVQPDKQPAEVP